MPTMWIPANRIVNQLMNARKTATAPRSPPSPNEVVVDPLSEEELDPKPIPAAPTRMMWGIASRRRKNVVRRLRLVSAGTTVTVTGYGIGRDYTERNGRPVVCLSMGLCPRFRSRRAVPLRELFGNQ